MFDNEITWIQQQHQQCNKNELITKHQRQNQERKKSYAWYMCFQLCKTVFTKIRNRNFKHGGWGEASGGEAATIIIRDEHIARVNVIAV